MSLGIIQARQTSTRLPGKVLMSVCGIPLLELMIGRLKRSEKLSDIVVAIPDNEENEELKKFLVERGIPHYCGSENDVLGRFYEAAATKGNPDTLVRMTGDCPLIDPATVDFILGEYEKSDSDYARTSSSFADGNGVEVFSSKALKEAHDRAELVEDREHVTTFLKNNPDDFKCISIDNDRDEQHLRYTVDTIDDLNVVTRIVEHFRANPYAFTSADVFDFLMSNPEVIAMNDQYARAHRDGKI